MRCVIEVCVEGRVVYVFMCSCSQYCGQHKLQNVGEVKTINMKKSLALLLPLIAGIQS